MPDEKRKRPRKYKPRKQLETVDRQLYLQTLPEDVRAVFGSALSALPVAVLMWARPLYDAGYRAGQILPSVSQRPPNAPGSTRTPARVWTPAPTVLPPEQRGDGQEAHPEPPPGNELDAYVTAPDDPGGWYAPIGHYGVAVVRAVVDQAIAISTDPAKGARIAREQLARCEPLQEDPSSSIVAQIEARLKKEKAFNYSHPLEDMSAGSWQEGTPRE